MISGRNYIGTKKNNVYIVCEMDKDYNLTSQRINPANAANNVFSVAKFFTTTAIGMCIDRGLLTTEDKFLDIMEMPLPEGADEKWKNVTVHMLLKHRAGFGRGLLDIDVDNVSSYGTNDYLSVVLREPLPEKQGEHYQYTDAAFYLLSRVVEKVSSQTLFDFLRPTLMDTMGFSEYAWASCPLGHTMGATGLYIRCEDMVKLGALYLNCGEYKGIRVVSEEWCNTVKERGYELGFIGHGWYGKGGMNGQLVAVNYEKGYAFACLSHTNNLPLEEMLF